MPYFVVEYSYTAETTAGRDTHRAAHRAWLADLVDTGTVITCGPYGNDAGAFIIVNADTTETVRALFADDPFAVHGLVPDQRILHWTPVLGNLDASDAISQAELSSRPGGSHS
ncbi:YciI family protein [Rhodococcus opacus]|uniref:YCII-related domain-containing protein n=1 Tax=Rhodococcus opacus (strain B4) TaxID=632772 RepID=C1B3D9_RHOOB|nr:YciI family protein [Rhodococcus opacus]BAH50637.1 hypothetical protein ROP_23900 [Rhodococcus opacus B4]